MNNLHVIRHVCYVPNLNHRVGLETDDVHQICRCVSSRGVSWMDMCICVLRTCCVTNTWVISVSPAEASAAADSDQNMQPRLEGWNRVWSYGCSRRRYCKLFALSPNRCSFYLPGPEREAAVKTHTHTHTDCSDWLEVWQIVSESFSQLLLPGWKWRHLKKDTTHKELSCVEIELLFISKRPASLSLSILSSLRSCSSSLPRLSLGGGWGCWQ